MSSSLSTRDAVLFTHTHFPSATSTTHPSPHQYYSDCYLPTPQSSSSESDSAYLSAAAYSQALGILQQTAALQLQRQDSTFSNIDTKETDTTIASSTSSVSRRDAVLPPYHHTAFVSPPATGIPQHQHVATALEPTQPSWSMYQTSQYQQQPQQQQQPYLQHHTFNSMGAPVAAFSSQGFKRQRSHQRTPSASTIGSNGPASPYSQTTSYPHIVSTDFAPDADQSPAHFSSKTPSQVSGYANGAYLPSQGSHLPAAHLAMKGFAIDHHNLDDLPSDFPHSSRHSMSSVGQESPATPRSAADEQDATPVKQATNEYRPANPNVQLMRTESAAYQDELYNPANFVQPSTSSSSSKPHNQYLSPSNHRNLVNERLQTANIARSSSPTSAMSRERSPFRRGSPLAPVVDGWNSPRPALGTALGMRLQQKEATEEAEYAQHRPALQREPTKTISPKDALLDYTDADQPPLFQDSIPAGYKQHFGGTEEYPNNFMNQSNVSYTGMPSGQQNMATFRATNSSDGFTGSNFNFPPPAFQGQAPITNNPFNSGNYQQAPAVTSYPTTALTEATPEFPPTLTSMESSMSDQGVMPSSQDSGTFPTIQRPADTRANTGTYTCTYHGCTQRFDSHQNLQRHKRDLHRSQQQQQQQQQQQDDASSGTASESPRSTESPGPTTGGMTSAAILARNSQAGPHKCSRINPSTGKPCNTVFSRPYDLTRHEDTIHNNRKQKVRCPYCREEKSFSRNDALTRHMRVVHPEVDAYGKRSRRGD